MWCTSSLQTNQSISSYVAHLHRTASERSGSFRMWQHAPSSEWAIILLRCYLHPASVRLGLNGYKYECSWVSTMCKKKKEGCTGRLTWVLPLQGKLSPFMWGAFQISDLSENKRFQDRTNGDAQVPNIQVKLYISFNGSESWQTSPSPGQCASAHVHPNLYLSLLSTAQVVRVRKQAKPQLLSVSWESGFCWAGCTCDKNQNALHIPPPSSFSLL